MDPLRQFFLFFLKNAQNDWDAQAIISNCLETETGVRTQCHLNVFCICCTWYIFNYRYFWKIIGRSKGWQGGPHFLRLIFLQSHAGFWQHFCKIIIWHSHLWGCPPPPVPRNPGCTSENAWIFVVEGIQDMFHMLDHAYPENGNETLQIMWSNSIKDLLENKTEFQKNLSTDHSN